MGQSESEDKIDRDHQDMWSSFMGVAFGGLVLLLVCLFAMTRPGADVGNHGGAAWILFFLSLVLLTIPASAVVHYQIALQDDDAHKDEVEKGDKTNIVLLALMVVGVLSPLALGFVSYLVLKGSIAANNRSQFHSNDRYDQNAVISMGIFHWICGLILGGAQLGMAAKLAIDLKAYSP